MIRRPRPGQPVTLRYGGPRRKGAPSMREHTGLHLARGVVVVSGGGYWVGAMAGTCHVDSLAGPFPVNALVRLDDDRQVVVPRGQLFAEEADHA